MNYVSLTNSSGDNATEEGRKEGRKEGRRQEEVGRERGARFGKCPRGRRKSTDVAAIDETSSPKCHNVLRVCLSVSYC